MNDWNKKIRMRLPALFFLCFTVLFWSSYDRYEATGPVILSSPGIQDVHRIQGDCSGDGTRFTLRVTDDGRMAQMNFRIPDATRYNRLRVTARMKLHDVIPGRYSWSCARLVLLQYDADDHWLTGEHGIVAEKGTQDWIVHEDVFDVFSDAVNIDVGLQHMGRSGTAEFDRIAVQPVGFRSSFWWWQALFLCCWLAAGIIYFPRCRLNNRKLKVLITLNVIAILAGTLTPGIWISSRVEQIKETAIQIISNSEKTDRAEYVAIDGKPTDPIKLKIDRFQSAFGQVHEVGHFALFASLCFLVYLSAGLERQHPVYFVKVGGDVLLFAGITESLQFLTLDRSPGVGDLWLDIYGMGTALLLFLFILPLIRRYQQKIR